MKISLLVPFSKEQELFKKKEKIINFIQFHLQVTFSMPYILLVFDLNVRVALKNVIPIQIVRGSVGDSSQNNQVSWIINSNENVIITILLAFRVWKKNYEFIKTYDVIIFYKYS